MKKVCMWGGESVERCMRACKCGYIVRVYAEMWGARGGMYGYVCVGVYGSMQGCMCVRGYM